jgi:hypothetical protein
MPGVAVARLPAAASCGPRTRAKVVCVLDQDRLGAFVVTAYDLRAKSFGGLSLPQAEVTMATNKREYPPGWDQRRVQDLLDHYERQTDDEAAAEHEAASSRPDHGKACPEAGAATPIAPVE